MGVIRESERAAAVDVHGGIGWLDGREEGEEARGIRRVGARVRKDSGEERLG